MIPGPRSRALAERLAAVESRNVTFVSDEWPTFWDRGAGSTISDVDGNRYIDVTAAFGVAVTGHANPAVARAVAVQAERLIHAMGDVHPSVPKLELLERLCALAPMSPAKGYLCTSGADAIEFARKTALLATGRPDVLAFDGSYHGLSYGALEVSGTPRFRAPFEPQLRGTTTFVPYADRRVPGAFDATLSAVDAALIQEPRMGAVIVEPIQGRAGVIVPPDGWLSALRRACHERDRLLIVDEIYTGFGRTGALFAVQHENVAPHMLCVGKALAAGLPLAAVLARGDVMDAWPASTGEALHTSTHLGNPLGCAAALANLDEMDRLDVVGRARKLHTLIDTALAPLRDVPWVRDVRGRGALWGIECDDGGRAHAWTTAALRHGVIVLQSGHRGETLTIAPPLVIDDAELDRALALLMESMPS